MNFYLVISLSLSIVIPALIGLIRFKRINEAYHPFIIFIWVGAINEIFGVIMMYIQNSNIVNLNIYLLIESFLLLWQFTRWGILPKKSFWIPLLSISFIIFWIVENFIIYTITRYDSWFMIFYSALFTFMSISAINKLLVTERKSLIWNPIFIICAAFIIYFTTIILSEVFWVYGISQNETFASKVYSISVIINFISIIFYTLAILWMPIKHRFTLPSS